MSPPRMDNDQKVCLYRVMMALLQGERMAAITVCGRYEALFYVDTTSDHNGVWALRSSIYVDTTSDRTEESLQSIYVRQVS